MATDYPGQVQCILLRNTSATDPEDKFPYDTSGFKGLNESTYMFFKVSVGSPPPFSSYPLALASTDIAPQQDDLVNLDIANGQCRNTTIPQNVTFSTQGLPFGLSKDNKEGAGGRLAPWNTWGFAAVMGAVIWVFGLGL